MVAFAKSRSAEPEYLTFVLIDAPRSATYSAAMLPHGFTWLPTKAPQPPSGDGSLHEIKHDGFRVIARKHSDRTRLYSPGNRLTYCFPLIVEALARLRALLRRRGMGREAPSHATMRRAK